MSYRHMRVILFFDLPTLTAADRGNYNKFRKFLIKDGFFMMQESVYCKIALNQIVANTIIAQVKANKPAAGLVQVLLVTEKQYEKMEFIIGDSKTDVINSTDRMVVL